MSLHLLLSHMCRKSGPNIWRFRGNLIRAMFHSCVMPVAKHDAHRMFAGNLWPSLSCLSSRQLPLQLLTPEHSHSNPKNMNWRNIFCEKSGNGFGVWEIGVWEKIEHLDSKHRFWGPYGRICSLFPQFCCRGVSEVQVADTLNEAVGHGVCTCSRLPGMTLGKPWKPNKKPPV